MSVDKRDMGSKKFRSMHTVLVDQEWRRSIDAVNENSVDSQGGDFYRADLLIDRTTLFIYQHVLSKISLIEAEPLTVTISNPCVRRFCCICLSTAR